MFDKRNNSIKQMWKNSWFVVLKAEISPVIGSKSQNFPTPLSFRALD